MAEHLVTPRLIVRPFVDDDLDPIHRILEQCFGDGTKVTDAAARADRLSWLRWCTLSQRWLPAMHQPPYGDRAVVLRDSGTLVGAVGLVPLLRPFEQIEALRPPGVPDSGRFTCEMGLFWAIDQDHQKLGFATEAARAIVDFAFTQLRVKRLLATADYENPASQAVMRKLGMALHRNPRPDPPWFQMVGVLDNSG